MARILQIRRGTTAQNDNFTGLAGEITMDTETKTLRVHDGETLGGVTLARADAIADASFDITTVSDDFWTALFARMGATTPTLMSSRELPIPSGVSSTYTFNTTRTPIFARAMLVCSADDAGYTAGDTVAAFGIGTRTNPAPNVRQSDDGVTVQLVIGSEAFWVSNPQDGTSTPITPTAWRMKYLVYC